MTREVKIGKIRIGGNNPVAIQSMTTFRPSDVENTLAQIASLEKAGCDIVRFCILDEADCLAIPKIKEMTDMPIVADIHFDYRLAIKAIENGADKIRINPGNIGGADKTAMVADCIKAHKIPVRVGANSGSIEKELLKKYGVSEKSLSESVLNQVKILEKQGVNDIVLSVKSSDVSLTVKSCRLLSGLTDYPLHIGVTEAGGGEQGLIKNAVGIGSLILDGIGDTIRVSLSDDPVKEVLGAKKILRAIGKGEFVDVVACPTCGRCEWDCMAFAKEVEKRTADINKKFKVSVMGCVVNGIGEGKESDLGIAGGKDKAVIFKKGEILAELPFEEAKEVFFKELTKCLN